jgi:alkylhydroperoxidase family enzyme
MDAGVADGKKAGLTEKQLLSLADFENSPEFSDIQKLALRYAVALTATPVVVSDALVADLKRHFNNQQLVELTSALAWENYWSRFNHAFGVGAEGFSEGAVCALRPPAEPTA